MYKSERQKQNDHRTKQESAAAAEEVAWNDVKKLGLGRVYRYVEDTR